MLNFLFTGFLFFAFLLGALFLFLYATSFISAIVDEELEELSEQAKRMKARELLEKSWRK